MKGRILWILISWLNYCRTEDINVAGLYPLIGNGTDHQEGDGVLPAVDLAIRRVNELSQLLQGHKLEIVTHDTEVRKILSFYTKIISPFLDTNSKNGYMGLRQPENQPVAR